MLKDSPSAPLAKAPLLRRLRLKCLRRKQEQAPSAQTPAKELSLKTSADTGRAAITGDSPSSEEDVSAEVLGRSTDLPAPKARVSLEEVRRLLGHRGRHAATAKMPAMERCLPSEQVPFDDSPSGQGLSAQERCKEEPSAQRTSGQAHLVHKPLEQVGTDKGTDGETRHGVEAIAEEAARSSSRESLRISAATEILEIKDDTPLEEEKVESVRGTPTGVLCEQVVPLLRYLNCKATKDADPCHRGSYVELVRNWTPIKVAMNPELEALDEKYRQLEERCNFLQE
ncbi:hypothetical protein AXG93_2841s1290 [Marchantia polymorpha subsp. ruderalis]|uniref:Uncharacterized protein n=1 Tax=Marchantia polymorpha subsp. ruderalis TaxID=1480154 RepID=A0A176WRX6_MARPO|nr:hypothetical protein AXG93_2841s1290 [Marchantia polymorpha subsp. ruderalis]